MFPLLVVIFSVLLDSRYVYVSVALLSHSMPALFSPPPVYRKYTLSFVCFALISVVEAFIGLVKSLLTMDFVGVIPW
jgi:hypothetical protein